ncbi:glycosyltransferase family 8 protein [Campylobacter jejuni]|nr:glycosyltransferase family 8 protein [Campylobacter jejuni]ECQ9161608.1 glycosyltransferase family 8 protein [Campylobacter jejuni]EDP4524588.1 glycosyltransferase family 8 protein [Campylobacter jejuni]
MKNEITIDNYYKYVEPLFDDKIAIVFSIDENYINYLCVTLESLKRNSLSKDNYDIVILCSDLEDHKKNIIVSHYSSNNFSIRFIGIDDIMKQIDNSIFYSPQHFTIAAYYRFFIPNLFKQYKKVVYADCDAIFLEDVAMCYNIDLKDNLLAVVLDVEIQRTHFLKNCDWSKNFIDYLKNDLVLKKSENYFQSGFIIFNIQKCLEFNLLEKCITKLEEIKTPVYVDQDILNKVAEGNVKFLDLSWNVENHIMVFDRANSDNLPKNILKQYLESLEEAKFLHFSGCIKPWQNPKSYNAHLWWHYARQTPFYEEILFKNITQNSLNIIQNSIQGAVERVKAHLSYKLGKEILSIKENKLKILILPLLPFTLIFIYIKHKISNLIFKLILNSNPNLKSLPLNHYSDYQEALKIQNYLSYKLGNLLIKHPFSFVFRIARVYREWRKGR